MQTQPLSGEVYAVHPDLSQPVLVFIALEVVPGIEGGFIFPPIQLSRGEMMERMLTAYRENKTVIHDDPDGEGIYIVTVLPVEWDRNALLDMLDEACEVFNTAVGF